jgi:hypothetical protein
MVAAHEDESDEVPHPYWYARVIGIFHVNVGQRGSNIRPKRMDFLWVRWFGRDLAHKGGWRARRLHRIGFVESQDPTAFSFLDPASVIRAVHLIPAFSLGKTVADVDPSHEDIDWQQYYVNMYVTSFKYLSSNLFISIRFVDQDMFMRFQGGGVGHKSTRKETDQFLSDCHVLDLAEEASCEGEVEEEAEDCFEGSEESEIDDETEAEDEDEEGDNDDNGDDEVIEDGDVELDQDADAACY